MSKLYKHNRTVVWNSSVKLLKNKSIQSIKTKNYRTLRLKYQPFVSFKTVTSPYKSMLLNQEFFLHSRVNRYLSSLSEKNFKIVGPKAPRLSHLKTLNNLNWKFWNDKSSNDFYMLKSINLKVQTLYERKYTRGGFWVFKLSSKYYNSKLFRSSMKQLKYNFTNTDKMFTYINASNLDRFKKKNLFFKKTRSVGLRGVKRIQNFHMFKVKLLITKPLNFTNGSIGKYKNYVNSVDELLSTRTNYYKRVKKIKNLKKLLSVKNSRFHHKRLGVLHTTKLFSKSFKLLNKTVFENLKPKSLSENSLLQRLNIKHLKPLSTLTLYTPNLKILFEKDVLVTNQTILDIYKTHPHIKVTELNLTKLTLNFRNYSFSNKLLIDNLQTVKGSKDLLLSTKHNLNLTFSNISMFLTSVNMLALQNINEYKYTWRKKVYSFIQPNEYRNSLFFRKKKNFINSIFKNQNTFFTNMLNNKSYNSIFLQNLLKNSSMQINIQNQRNTNTPPQTLFKTIQGRNLTDLWVDYKFNATYRESRINRVRFKPGYQNIWRRVRGALKEYLNLKYLYQQQLTKYLSKFYVSSNRYLWGNSEMSIFRVFIYSRLLPDKSAFDLFWSEKFIFINGILPLNKNSTLSVGDVVQLLVSVNYYIIHRWLVTSSKDRGNKLKRLVYKKGLSRKYKIIKQRKQKSYYTPTWIYKNRFDFSDVKCFLEVDYFTLSAIILYTPYLFNYHSYDNQLDLKINTFRLYNWKYIT